MKIAALIGTSVLGLLLGTPAPANAQHGQDEGRHAAPQKKQGNAHGKEHGRSSAQQHSERHEAKGSERRHEQRAHEQRTDQRRPERQQPHYQRANGQEHSREVSRHEFEQRSRWRGDVWQDHRAQHWEREHRPWHERGGYRGYRIPEDRFRAHFGRGHCFRVRNAPIIVVDGYPRFQYVGFWFSPVDPWPEYWSRTWYETDDVYVDYVNDGYYLYNRRDPGIAIAVNVSF